MSQIVSPEAEGPASRYLVDSLKQDYRCSDVLIHLPNIEHRLKASASSGLPFKASAACLYVIHFRSRFFISGYSASIFSTVASKNL